MVKADDIQIHFWISDFCALIISTLFMSPLVPAVLPLAFGGCIAYYWASKYVILRKCMAEQFSTRKVAFKILRKTVWFTLLWAASFLYIWTKINGEFFDFYNLEEVLNTSFFESSDFPAYLLALLIFQTFFSPYINNRLFGCIDAIYNIGSSSKKYTNEPNLFKDIFSLEFTHDYQRDYPLT